MNIKTIPITSWTEYRKEIDSGNFQSWAFRGQSDSAWPLLSSLSRHLKYSGVHSDAWIAQERRIGRIFRRKAYQFLSHVPKEADAFEWLALMQHHGAPSRLLDVTWSPYVAMFFAIEHGAREAAVWTFNTAAISEHEKQELRTGDIVDLRRVGTWIDGSYQRDFLCAKLPFVIIGEPHIMNQRLIAQAGSFIILSLLDRSIEEIVSSYARPETLIVKFVIDVAAVREEAMQALYSMNITHATLFPGLDGLARSMAYELEYHWGFNTKTMRAYAGYPAPQSLWHWNEDRPENDRPDAG